MPDIAPPVVTRYLAAADSHDWAALAECFTTDATVVDEDHTYRGADEIRRWREETASKWTYTTTVTGSEAKSSTAFRVTTHIAGNFPGGEADLAFDFTLVGDLIGALSIAP
ncbi:MAG: hypothetical protein JWM76_1412 [Pseudonocardiales bacterium]|nr:hypothetical protein [Pseudonocardiales bacterium]